MRLRWTAAVAGIVGALALAGPAAAAGVRYVTPGGTGPDPCTSDQPCNLRVGIEDADTGDEVVVAPGDYTEASAITYPGIPLTVHGSPAARPVITIPRLVVVGTLRDVELRRGGSTTDHLLHVEDTPNAVIERVRAVIDNGGSGGACLLDGAENAVIRDSACVSNNASSALWVFNSNATVRNVTAYGNYPIGVFAESLAGPYDVTIVNSIALSSVDGEDIHVESSGGNTAPVSATASFSNFDNSSASGGVASFSGGEGIQEALPLLVDVAAADVTQQGASPTRNAGTASGVLDGELSLFGMPRVLDGAPDMGAHELVAPPVVTTGAASGVSHDAATLGGTADGRGLPGTAYVEYGQTEGYGSRTGDVAITGNGVEQVAAAVTGLAPATLYHHRLVVTTAGGTVTGADATFTTAAPPPTPLPPPPSVDLLAPVLDRLALSRSAFPVAAGVTALAAQARGGTTLSYRLGEAATVRIAVQRRFRGRRARGRCVPRRRRGPRCTGHRTVATLTRQGVPGVNRVPFTGRLRVGRRVRALSPGRYRFSLRATDAAGNRSPARTIAFRIVPRR